MKLNKLIDLYIESQKYYIKKRTYLFYKSINEIYITRHFIFELSNLSENTLNEKFASIKDFLSYSTLKVIRSLINRSLIFATQNGEINHILQIITKIKQKNSRKISALDKKEQEKIEQYILTKKSIYHYGMLISMWTGLRIGELLSLKWKDIDFKEKLINVSATTCKIISNHKQIAIDDVPKTYSSIRSIPITNKINNLFAEILKKNKNSNFIFLNKNYKRLDMRTYQESFRRLLNKLKIKHYGFHSLRHTFATRLLENGVDIKTISELMGHSSPTITLNVYVHTNIQNKRKSMEKLS